VLELHDTLSSRSNSSLSRAGKGRRGQPLTTLSGGERQHLKLATHWADKGGVYVLDEPTSGQHLADVEQLLALLDRLVDVGKSVIVMGHHQGIMAHAD
jgi:excinuclease UvrABC ATPase subunit